MKNRYILFIYILLLSMSTSFAQDKKVYTTTIIEFPLTWSNATDNDVDVTGPVRFAPFFNFQNLTNIDFSEKAGMFAGFGIHNVGFIYDVDASTRKKVRSYNLGIPVGLKFGNMMNSYIYGGYEVEFPFAYKEKTFVNEVKTKYNKWFSSKTAIQQSVMVGVQLPQGMNVKFKYYFTNFYKQSYSEVNQDGETIQPYENFNSNVFWVSVNIVLFRGTEFTY